MNTAPVPSRAPPESAICAYLPGADFHDAWAIEAGDPSLSALGQFLKAVAATPGWVNGLMNLRNRAVALVGLKNLGALPGHKRSRPVGEYGPGQRVSIFTLIGNTEDEALLGDSDKHLDVTLSVHKARHSAESATITVTTVVHIHNLLGRLYMLPVAPMHKLIVPVVLKAIGRQWHAV